MNKIYILAFLLFIGCSTEKVEIPTEKADPNFVVYHMENSKGIPLFANRPFGELVIFSKANTFEGRAQTSLLAAKRYLEQEGLKYVRVFHLAYGHEILVGNGSYIAKAEYAPDGKGSNASPSFTHKTWQASAVKGDVDTVNAMIEVMWYQMRDKYQKTDSYGKHTDEQALREAISKAVNGKISPDQISLPSYVLIEY